MAQRKSRLFIAGLLLASGAFGSSPAVAEDLPFSARQMGVCDYAVGASSTNKSLRSLYSCKDKMVIITNETTKTLAFGDIVINQNKCKNHLFLDGDAGGPLKAGDRIVFATTCMVSRIDLSVNGGAYSYKF